MPRNDAADRYSPEMAAAFHHGVTAREATNRSDVVRAKRTPYSPSPTVADVTARIAPSAITSMARSDRGASHRARSPGRLHEVAERLLERGRAARVQPRDRDEQGERRQRHDQN